MLVSDAFADSRANPGFPVVSILIAVRNEEQTILDCLSAIEKITYPTDYTEVLIGNDQSTDQTRNKVANFIADRPGYQLIDITTSFKELKGKANVLAQLANQARGSLFFFTDADTQVPPKWINEIVTQFTGQPGIVTGVTLPEGASLFHKLQAIDWLYNLTLTHLLSMFGIPVTAMGNNMAVSRQAYEAVGGYESLKFSVVEDYTLFQAVVTKGYGFCNLLSEGVLAKTTPVNTLNSFFQQRKRWMKGASALPVWMVISLYGQYLAGPLLVLLCLFSPLLAIVIYVIKLFIQTLVLSFGLSRLDQTKLWPYALLFEIYQLIIGPLSVAFYLLPIKIVWKGRTYD